METHLAQLNLGQLKHPLDSPDMTEFVAALGPINEIAETTPGFVWRLTDESGASSSYVSIPGVDDPLTAVNYSIWDDIESLKHFMFKSGHATYLRRRRDWFEPTDVEMTVCWWIEAGTVPLLGEAHDRLVEFRDAGRTERGWPMNNPWPRPA